MNIIEAAAICYGKPTAEERRRALIRELESEAETERMRIRLHETAAREQLRKRRHAKYRLRIILNDLRELGVLLP
jgi:ribosome recycling factor